MNRFEEISNSEDLEDGEIFDSTPSVKDTRPSITPSVTAKECKYYLRGQCRHGYAGNVVVNGKVKCDFLHPPLCKSFLANGEGEKGCKGDCGFKHPVLCKESKDNRKCSKMKEGSKRCHKGYHLRGTSRIVSNPNEKEVDSGKSEKSNSKKRRYETSNSYKDESDEDGDDAKKMEDFLSGIVTLQIKKALQALTMEKEPQGRMKKRKTGRELLLELLN